MALTRIMIFAFYLTLQLCAAAAAVISTRRVPSLTFCLMSGCAAACFVISLLYNTPLVDVAPLTRRWNLAAVKTFEVVGLACGAVCWYHRYGCRRVSGVYATGILLMNILWTVSVERAVGTVTTWCGVARLITVAALTLSVIVRGKAMHARGVKLLDYAADDHVLMYRPLSLTWVIPYCIWDTLFVSAVGHPEQSMHTLTWIVGIAIENRVNPKARCIGIAVRFLSHRAITLGSFVVVKLLLECTPLLNQHLVWSNSWGASDEPLAVLLNALVAVLALVDLASACLWRARLPLWCSTIFQHMCLWRARLPLWCCSIFQHLL